MSNFITLTHAVKKDKKEISVYAPNIFFMYDADSVGATHIVGPGGTIPVEETRAEIEALIEPQGEEDGRR